MAAPQIGEPVRISVAEYRGQLYILINPKIVETSEEKKFIREGCISFFEYRGHVPRYEWVILSSFDAQGNLYEIKAEGDFAMLLQHEIDHLNGTLYIDHLEKGEKDLVKVMEGI